MRTLIEAGIIIAFQEGSHKLLENGAIVIEDDEIDYVGKSYSGSHDKRIDARKNIVIPGLISTHCHSVESALYRSVKGDISTREFYNSDLYDRLILQPTNKEDAGTCARFSMAELLQSGATTVVDIGLPNIMGEETGETLQRIPLRKYLLMSYASGMWYTPDGRRIQYRNFDGESWDETSGFRELERSLRFIKYVKRLKNPSIDTMLNPNSTDTCSPKLLEETKKVAEKYQLRVNIHVGQSVIEFLEMMQRYGMSSLQFLDKLGLLNPNTMLGHAALIAGHRHLPFYEPLHVDFHLLRQSGASISHSPSLLARYGLTLQSLASLLRAGVNVAIGNDGFPLDILLELRMAAMTGKISDHDPHACTSAEIFNCATLGGAKALGRNDLGRICKGAKADLVLLKKDSFRLSPTRDPIRSLIMCASSRDVDSVLVGGKEVVSDGKILDLDEEKLTHEVQKAAERSWSKLADADWRKRNMDEFSPPSLSRWTE